MTPEQIQLVNELHAQGVDRELIADRIGVRPDTVRRALDPAFLEKRRLASKRHRERASIQKAMGLAGVSDCAASAPRNPLYDPFRDGPPVYRSVGDWITGNPPIGRSALDMRGGR